MDGKQRNVTVCIIGGGVRGLGVLERIVAHMQRRLDGLQLDVVLVEPSRFGPPQYDTRQLDHLLLNIVACQVSMFPGPQSVGPSPRITGPDLCEWANSRGYGIGTDGYTVGREGRSILPTDFLPRRVFGEYLLWFQNHIFEIAPKNARIAVRRRAAIDLRSRGKTYQITLDGGLDIEADYVFLTTGQRPEPPSGERKNLASTHLLPAYPLPESLHLIKPGQAVAIAGLGLTAVDAILALTVGRGGRFERTDHAVRYVRSGSEPRIFAFSRSGLPYRSRPSLTSKYRYEPVAFSKSRVDEIRKSVGHPLDFDVHILPELFRESRAAFHRVRAAQSESDGDEQEILRSMRDATASGGLELLLQEMDNDQGRFDAAAAYKGVLPTSSGLDPMASSQIYQASLAQFLREDLIEARIGLAQSPVKSALEVYRELREVVRYAVDFDGLTTQSRAKFYSYHSQTMNRLVVGPQLERTEELLILLDAGILQFPFGPDPTVAYSDGHLGWTIETSCFRDVYRAQVDWVIEGNVRHLRSMERGPSIMEAMLRRGDLSLTEIQGSKIQSIDLDRRLHPAGADGILRSRVWVLGPLCEGTTYYNNYVPSPKQFARSQHDSDSAVRELFAVHVERVRAVRDQ